MTQLAHAPEVGFVVGTAAGAGAAAPHLGPIEEHLEKYPKHISQNAKKVAANS